MTTILAAQPGRGAEVARGVWDAEVAGSNPVAPTISLPGPAGVAQLAERVPSKHQVAGSRPVSRSTPTAEKLIARHVEPHPARPGRAEWRLKERGVPVWAVIGALVLTDNPAENPTVLSDEAVAPLLAERQAIEQVAANYDISREAVEAAIAYYWQHKPLIDARLLANAG